MFRAKAVWLQLSLKWLSSSVLLFSPLLSYAACGTNDVGGTAYLELPIKLNSSGQEANDYGTRQVDNELGLTGITVKVIDPTGLSQNTVTDSLGNWSVVAPSFPVRVEYLPSALLFSGPVGAQSKSSVQFVQNANCHVDLGLQHPDDYSQIFPRIVLPSYVAGSGVNETEAALSSYLYDANASYAGMSIAAISEVGSLWGLAWQRNKQRLFGASVLKRHVANADGLGYVYVFDQQFLPGSFVRKFNLQGVTPANGGAAIDLGSACRSAACASASGNTGVVADYVLPEDRAQPNIDLDAFFKAGLTGFGDSDIQPNSNILWLVNAYQRALISVDVSNNDPTALPGTINQYLFTNLVGTPSCTGGELRPWALGFNAGKGYVGLTCDARTSQDAKDLHAYIMSFDPANVLAGLTAVYDFALDYTRDTSINKVFNPWLTPSTLNNLAGLIGPNAYLEYPQPLLADIEFDEAGNFYLTVMDVLGLQHGHGQLPPVSQATSPVFNAAINGDLLKICHTSSGLNMEGSAACPASALVASGVGPSGHGEFFDDHSGSAGVESASGGLALLKGAGELLGAVADPHDPNPANNTGQFNDTQGFHAFSLDNGQILRWHLTAYNNPGHFGKAAGIGDLELLSEAAPIEVGNRVWIDSDADGLQDPDESGVDGVKVQLQCSKHALQIAEVSTSQGGEYLFSTVTNASFMDEGESCTLKIVPKQMPLANYLPTTANTDGLTDNNPNSDLRDSDASDQAGTAELNFIVGKYGENNHSLDFGFKLAPATDLTLNKVLSKTTAKRGEQVIYTLSLTNESKTAATNVEVKDLLPAGLSYISDDGLSGYGNDVYDEVTGLWVVGTVPMGSSKVLNITVQVQ